MTQQGLARLMKERDEALLKIEELESDSEGSFELVEKLSGILSKSAVALRGPEPPLTRWSFHDIPERIEKLRERHEWMVREYAALEKKHAELQKKLDGQEDEVDDLKDSLRRAYGAD